MQILDIQRFLFTKPAKFTTLLCVSTYYIHGNGLLFYPIRVTTKIILANKEKKFQRN